MPRTKKSFGQHFLHEQSVIGKICTAAEVTKFPVVVEVGPGEGALTTPLAEQLRPEQHLVLIEADRDFVPALEQKFPMATVVRADAAQVDYQQMFMRLSEVHRKTTDLSAWLLVGNLPYNSATAILMQAIESLRPPTRLVVMVQKEAGERLLGLPASRGLLTVAVGLFGLVSRVAVVKPGSFIPPPKVDSMVVAIERFATPLIDAAMRERVLALAKDGFANRRKQLRKNLSHVPGGPAAVGEALLTLGKPADARAETLTISDWIALTGKIHPGE